MRRATLWTEVAVVINGASAHDTEVLLPNDIRALRSAGLIDNAGAQTRQVPIVSSNIMDI